MATEGDRGDIHFPPGQRREKPTFEPPPWERDQFEELSRRKQEMEAQQAADQQALEEAVEQQVAEEAPVPPAPQQPAVSAAAATEAPATEGPAAGEPAQVESGDKPPLGEKQLELLMMGLRAEEPEPEAAYRGVSIAAGAVIALIGVLLTTWAVVGFASSLSGGNLAQWFFVLVLLVFGVGFLGGGGWMVFRALRQQGVL